MIGTDRNKTYHLMRAALAYADVIKKVATCNRAQYACVLTDLDLKVLSYGFNGVAKGIPNGCLRPNYDKEGEQVNNVVVHGCGCIHAEANSVMALRSSTHQGAIVAFITGAPCEQCAMLLINAGCVMVVFDRAAHRTYGGEALLKQAGIPFGKATEMAALLERGYEIARG